MNRTDNVQVMAKKYLKMYLKRSFKYIRANCEQSFVHLMHTSASGRIHNRKVDTDLVL